MIVLTFPFPFLLFCFVLLGNQFYVTLNTSFDQSFSTNPSRGPVPVWNQTFTVQVRSFDSEITFEILKYDQYKINGKLINFFTTFYFVFIQCFNLIQKIIIKNLLASSNLRWTF